MNIKSPFDPDSADTSLLTETSDETEEILIQEETSEMKETTFDDLYFESESL